MRVAAALGLVAIATIAVQPATAGDEPGLQTMVLMQVEAFIPEHRCQHLFVEVGVAWYAFSHWKLFFPTNFTGAPLLKVFDEIFGPPPRCHVCSIAFEANRNTHRDTLNQIEHLFVRAGAPVLIIRAGASDHYGTMPFVGGGVGGRLVAAHESFPMLKNWSVPVVDFAEVMQHAARTLNLRGRARGGKTLLKLDCEGAEYTLLPHLDRTGAMCIFNNLLLEWHPMRPPSARLEHELYAAQFVKRAWSESAGGSRCTAPRIQAVDDETYLFTAIGQLQRIVTQSSGTPRCLCARHKTSARP